MPTSATPTPREVWIDAQLPPTLARWLARREITATHVQDLGLLKASDLTIFSQARDADVIIDTKDIDFVQLLERHGPPPRVLWVTCGNVSNAGLEELFSTAWERVAAAFASGEALVELAGGD